MSDSVVRSDLPKFKFTIPRTSTKYTIARICLEKRDFDALEAVIRSPELYLGEKAKIMGFLKQISYMPELSETEVRNFFDRFPCPDPFDYETKLVIGPAIPEASDQILDVKLSPNGLNIILLEPLGTVLDAQGKRTVGTLLTLHSPNGRQAIPLPAEFDTTTSRLLEVGEDITVVMAHSKSALQIGRVHWDGMVEQSNVVLGKNELYTWESKKESLWIFNRDSGVIRSICFSGEVAVETSVPTTIVAPELVTQILVRNCNEIWMASNDPETPLFCLGLNVIVSSWHPAPCSRGAGQTSLLGLLG